MPLSAGQTGDKQVLHTMTGKHMWLIYGRKRAICFMAKFKGTSSPQFVDDNNKQLLLSALRHRPTRPPPTLSHSFLPPFPSDFDTTRRGPDKSLFIMHARDRHGLQNELISQLGHYLLHFLRVQSGPLSINWRWGRRRRIEKGDKAVIEHIIHWILYCSITQQLPLWWKREMH